MKTEHDDAAATGRGALVWSLLFLLTLAAFLFSCQSANPDKHTLAISGPVHVYRTVTPPSDYPGPDFIDVIGPKDHVSVTEVVHERNYTAVRIRLADGREGWVFSGESIELR